MRIAVLGATGTAGYRVVSGLTTRDVDVVEVSRSQGIDLGDGDALREALRGVDTVIDASNPLPADPAQADVGEVMAAATSHVMDVCRAQRVGHLVFLSIAGIENPLFDEFDYYLAKREQERLVAAASIPSTIIKSTQWHEFATNPAAVTFESDEVRVHDWLIQPITADTVAEVLIQAAMAGPASAGTRVIAGPETIRLPELTGKLLAARGDPRPVRAVSPPLGALAHGALRAPPEAEILGPDIATWL